MELSMQDLYDEVHVDGHPAVRPALDIPAVAQWLMEARAMPAQEIQVMSGVITQHGPAVAFTYRDSNGSVRYTKYRALDKKRFWRSPAGATSMLYGLATLGSGPCVITTEGELDAHALHAVGLGPVVSVPDGVGSRLTAELLQPLKSFTQIFIAVDADEAGEAFARKLAGKLGPGRCRRMLFKADGVQYKDANDALRAGWGESEFNAAMNIATPMGEEKGSAVLDDGSDVPYRVVDGMLVRLLQDREGNTSNEVIANFAATIEEEIISDDGSERELIFRISGRHKDGSRFPDVMVAAADFPGMAWVSQHWGARAVVYAGHARKDHVRTAIQLLSSPARRSVYSHTGWRNEKGEWIYLHRTGAVGGATVEVKLDGPFERFVLPDVSEDPTEAVQHSLDLLRCGPASIMVPLLGATYAAPLSFILRPDFAVWLVGPTGSLKSELAALAQRHFGAFDRKSLPCSWASTSNALQEQLWVAKDALVVIDDFAPQADAHGQREQSRRAETVLRNIGNQAARGRLRADLSQRPVRPPRGLVVCTGEDHPTTRSIIARLVVVNVDRERLDLDAISRAQLAGHRLPHAMRAYIEWLRPRIDAMKESLPVELAAVVTGEFSAALLDSHLRAPGGLATIYLGLSLFLSFANEMNAISASAVADISQRAREALLGLGRQQAEGMGEISPAKRTLEILRTLMAQGRARVHNRDSIFDVQAQPGSEFIGWQDDEHFYLLPEAVAQVVAEFLRGLGEVGELSRQRLLDEMVRSRAAVPGPNGKPLTQLRFGKQRHRVLVVPRSVLEDSVAGSEGHAA
jgi:hypothetical protein